MKAQIQEFAVRREVMMRYFSPPIGKSTFYDLVQRGKIAEVHGLRGYYRLNESLSRLGMPPVEQLPQTEAVGIGDRVLADLALAISMPDEIHVPSELLSLALSESETKRILDLHEKYSQALNEITSSEERLAFVQGVRDAATI